VSRSTLITLSLITLALALASAACTQTATPQVTTPQATVPAEPSATQAEATATPVAEMTAPAETAAVTSSPEPAPTDTAQPSPTAADAAALCPQPGDQTSLYISRENGLCFLVPTGYKIQDELLRPGEVVTLLGPTEPLGPKQQEGITVMIQVEANGPSQGMDSATYAQEWHERFAGPDAPYEDTSVEIDDQTATLLKNLPGFSAQQAAFVIANDGRYRISLMPQPEDMPELAEAAQSGWDTVINSMVFFPPEEPFQVVLPEDVCPQEGNEGLLYIDEIAGYCFLYPTDFEPVADFPGVVTGGPVVGQWEGGDVRPSVAVGFYTPPGDLTARQIAEQRQEFIQPGSLEDATIGGYPAASFIDINGAWPSRQAIVVVDPGRAYSVLAQPLDEARFPEAPPYVEEGWETVTGSLAFFDPWR
jgi:hypothetical protein